MRLADAISLRSRRRKLRLFLDELHPTAETSVLDVGADELGFGDGRRLRDDELLRGALPVAGADHRARAPRRRRLPCALPRRIEYVQGDACALPFADGEFDVVFSNAVIEHVGGRERQRRFVSEAIRVGRRVFMTTPNRRFPVEVHTRLPFVHWLPDALSHRVYRAAGKSPRPSSTC